MNKILVMLSFAGVFLVWKFVLFPEKLDFTDRVKVRQGLVMAGPYKDAVLAYWREHGALPDSQQWDAQSPKVKVDFGTSIVGSIKVAEEAPGNITVYYSNARDQSIDPAISGKSIQLTPVAGKDGLGWSCKGTIPTEYLPGACR